MDNNTNKERFIIRIGCLPFIILFMDLFALKVAGETTMSWWLVFLMPLGMYWVYFILVMIFFLIVYSISRPKY